ncbi:sirohydrochlorin cobaltochelatase [uncultured Flavonifractor sp.]|uniref:sirohydrochlorin cobaltochelatase n=1 Tax=uncultured Flavonifractor sp. TaxID=1193534 RepID=UPI00261511EF|nr:sirohydrochlorin cobaltochelatase [uncultured Flavonifractor sp.]
MAQKALLAVSFGTSHADTLEKTIAAIEADLAAAFPERTLRRAFTSGMILRRWRRERGVELDDVPTALEKLAEEGYTDVLLQPTHVMNGEEYHKLSAQAEKFRRRFIRMAVGVPLLTAAEDYLELGRALLEVLPPRAAERVVVYMGHGSEHQANSAYALMEYAFHDLGRTDILVGTVEGYPDFAAVLRRLAERPQAKEVELRPLMTVAGDHAKNDLAGEEENSWKHVLESMGYGVTCVLTGLGEYSQVRALFVKHAGQAQAQAPV